MTRSTLNRINLLWTLAWLTMLLCGCTTSWVTEAQNIITLLGPAIGGLLVDTISWRVAFLMNIPITAIARLLDVNRKTLRNYIDNHELEKELRWRRFNKLGV